MLMASKERIGNKTQGGVQILIKDNINYIEVNLNTKNIDSVSIKLCDSTVLAMVYNPPNAKLNLRELESILRTGNKVLLYGDLNVKNSAWKCKNRNHNGKILLDFVLKNSYKIIHPDNFTLFPYSGALPSIVDIGLLKNFDCDIDINAVDELNSDHLPVLMTFQSFSNITQVETEFYNYKSANWNKYRNILFEKLEFVPNLKNMADIDKNVDRLTSVIKGAADLAIPKSRTGKLHINIPRHIKLLRKHRNALRKVCQRTSSSDIKKIYNKLAYKIKKDINNFYNKKWDINFQI